MSKIDVQNEESPFGFDPCFIQQAVNVDARTLRRYQAKGYPQHNRTL